MLIIWFYNPLSNFPEKKPATAHNEGTQRFELMTLGGPSQLDLSQ